MNLTLANALFAAMAERVPVLLWGMPGIGKTALVEAVARQQNLLLEPLILSHHEPADLTGLPVANSEGTQVTRAPADWAQRLVSAVDQGYDGAVLFLDELSTAPPAVQAAALQCVNERRVGNISLPDHVVVVAAANPPEIAAAGWDLAAPLANRFCHLDVEPDPEMWARGLVEGWDTITPVPTAGDVTAGAYAGARAAVASYIKAHPTVLLDVPVDVDSQGYGWPSPRSWERLARLVARLPEGDNAARFALAKGMIGEGAAVEFVTWLDNADLPSPEALLADPSAFDWNGERLDKVHVALDAVTALAAAKGTKTAWDQASKVLAACCDAGRADVALPAAQALWRTRPDGVTSPPKAFSSFKGVLDPAGYSLAADPGREAA